MSDIDIIGAGIGGLTAGIVLQRLGFKVNIFESALEILPLGSGIILANNAMQVYKELNLHEHLQKVGNKISYMKITDTDLKPISTIDLIKYEKKYNVYNLAIHRGALQELLIKEFGPENIILSKKLIAIKEGDVLELKFKDNSTYKSNILIGADGIHSIVRDQIFGKCDIRDSNQLCWRSIVQYNLPEKYHHELNEAWGIGKRFGFVKTSPTHVYWYALVNNTPGCTPNTDLKQVFKDFNPEILNLIDATLKDKIIFNSITDLKPIPEWQKHNVCLIGDAAHAMTPNLGQGACQAIEDAYVLGKQIEMGRDIKESFKRYEKLRMKKVQNLVNRSWNVGKIAQLDSRFLSGIRNNVLKLIPDSSNNTQMDKIFEIDHVL